jgi:hypothetical protein
MAAALAIEERSFRLSRYGTSAFWQSATSLAEVSQQREIHQQLLHILPRSLKDGSRYLLRAYSSAFEIESVVETFNLSPLREHNTQNFWHVDYTTSKSGNVSVSRMKVCRSSMILPHSSCLHGISFYISIVELRQKRRFVIIRASHISLSSPRAYSYSEMSR